MSRLPPPSTEGATRLIARNSAFLLVSRLAGMILSLATLPLLARYLGVESFGVFALISAIAMALTPIVDLGFERIVCREVAKDRANAGIYLATAISIRLALSALVFLAACLVIARVEPLGPRFGEPLMVAIAAELIAAVGQTYLSAIRAFERMEFELVAITLNRLIAFCGIVLVVMLDWGFNAVFYTQTAAAIVFTAVSALFMYRGFVPFVMGFKRVFALLTFKEALPLAIFSVLLALLFRTNAFLLQQLATKSDIAIFEAPNRIIMQAQIILMSITLSVFPLFSRTAGVSKDDLSRYYGGSCKAFLLIAVPISCLIILAARPLVGVLFGPEFANSSRVFVVIAPCLTILCLVSVQNYLLTAMGKQGLTILSVGLALAVNVLLDVALIPKYAYMGAAFATLASYALMLAMNYYSVARLGVRPALAKHALKAALAGAIMCVAGFIGAPYDIAAVLLRGCAAGTIYVLALMALRALSPEEIAMFKDAFFRRARRPEAPASSSEGAAARSRDQR